MEASVRKAVHSPFEKERCYSGAGENVYALLPVFHRLQSNSLQGLTMFVPFFSLVAERRQSLPPQWSPAPSYNIPLVLGGTTALLSALMILALCPFKAAPEAES